MSENPFIDDRDQQLSLDIGDAAARTEDRSGVTVTGSDMFLDDRDSGSGNNTGEQTGLFSETETLSGQQDLFGDTATEESAGFFDMGGDDSGPGLLSSAERDLGAAEAERNSPTLPEANLFDVSLSPEEAFDGVGATSTRAIGGFDSLRGRETDRPDDERVPPGMRPVEPDRVDIGIERNIAAAESAGVLSPEPNGDESMAPPDLFGGEPDRQSGSDPDNVRTVDLQRLENAEGVREEYSQWLDESDKRNRTTVRFHPSTPNGVINQAQLARDELIGETVRSQTASLSDDERATIKAAGGFGRKTTTANWRSAKGVFEREGIGDQFRDAIGSVADYDDPIEGAEEYVSRHKRQQAANRVGGIGARDDGERDIVGKQRAGRAAAREQQEFESFAIEGAKQGNQEAIDALVLEAGWDRAEAQALAGRVEDPRDSMTQSRFEEIVETEIKRSRSSGRFATEPTNQTTLPGVNRRRKSGRFIDVPLQDADIGRNVKTGRFVSTTEDML